MNPRNFLLVHWLRRSGIRGIITAILACAMSSQALYAADPQWWVNRGVLIPNKSPDDFAVLTQGQLKHFVTRAVEELNAELPGGAGHYLNDVVRQWRTASHADDFAVVSAAQLKHFGTLIAERIRLEGGMVRLPGTTVDEDDVNDSVVNIGQAKAAFNFRTEDLDVDHDGIPTSVEFANGSDPWLGNAPLPKLPPVSSVRGPAPAADGSGDTDSDGKKDFEDAVSYDRDFDHAPMAAPSYAIVELGRFQDGGIISSTHKGKFLWQKSKDVNGVADYVFWDINNPSAKRDFTLDQKTISPGGGSFNYITPLMLREDGKIMGYTREAAPSQNYRLASFSPGASASWEAQFAPPGSTGRRDPTFGFQSQLFAAHSANLLGGLAYSVYPRPSTPNDPLVTESWVAFVDWNNGSLQYSEAAANKDGWIYGRYLGQRNSEFGSAFWMSREKNTADTKVNMRDYFLQTDSGKHSFLTHNVIGNPNVSYSSFQVSRFEHPWVVASKYDSSQPPDKMFESIVYKPDEGGGNYHPCKIYAGSSYYPSAPLSGVSNGNPDRQFLVSTTGGTYLWANGELNDLATLANTSNGYTSWSLRAGNGSGMTTDGSFIGTGSQGSVKVLTLWMPVDFGIAAEDFTVAADAGEAAVPVYFEGIDPHVLGARVRFSVVEGPGSVATSVVEFELDEPDQEAILRPSSAVGSTCRVKAEITQLKIGDPEAPQSGQWMTASLTSTSGLITVGPGDVADIQFTGTSSLPADGTSYATLSARLTDAFGNPVAEGIPVNWRLQGDGRLESEVLETDASGVVTANLVSGRVPGASQMVIVEADETRVEFPVTNPSLGVGLAAGPVQSQQVPNGKVKTFTVTATATAANGTPVRWRTSQGSISPASSTISGGTAAATVSVQLPNEAGGAPVVVTVGVAESSAITSVEIGDPLTVTLNADPVLVRGRTACATISAPGMVGQQVLVEANLVREDKSVILQPQPQGADAYVNVPGMLTFSYRDYAAEVVWQRPLGPVQSSMVLLEHGSYVLSVGAEGLPQLAVDGLGGRFVLSITDPSCSPAPGNSTTIRVGHLMNGSLSLSCGGRTVSGFYVGKIAARTRIFNPGGGGGGPARSTGLGGGGGGIGLGGGGISLGGLGLGGGNLLLGGLQSLSITPAYIPATSCPHIQSVSVSGFYKTLETPVLGLCGEPPPAPISPGIYPPLSTVIPAGGSMQVALTAPQDPNMSAVIVRTTVGSLTNEVQWSVVSNYVFPRTTPAPDAPADAGGVAYTSADLYENVQYDNRAATPAEIQELRRYAGRNAALAAASGFTAHVEELAPPAPGGNLAHQAQQGRSFLEMAAEINGAISEIEQVSSRMDQLTITGEQKGKHLFQMNTAGLLRKVMGQGGGAVERWLTDGWDKLGDRLTTIGDEALTATVNSFQSTMSWTHAQLVAAKLDNVPLLAEADKLAQQLTEEGLVDYVKALARLTAAIAKNPQAASMHLITELETLVKPKLNEWAAAGGEDEQVAAAGAGMLAFGVQTGAMMASSACDSAAVRRMVAQALGTVISAALGSEDAQKELKELVPFWSWAIMGKDVAFLWRQADFYGSGKRAGELVVQIIGDFTILVPVVKGAQVAIKAVGAVNRASLKQALTKTFNGVFTRKKQKPVEGASEGITRCFLTDECFPGDTQVLMADGTWCRIDQVRENDLVMADNPFDPSPAAPQPVHGVVKHLTEQLHEIRVQSASYGSAGGTVRATAEHPFWVDGKGWVAAADLRSGMQLVTPQHETVTVTGVEAQAVFCTTWNLTVGGDHSYYVQAAGLPVLVHNINPGPRVFIVYEVKLPNGKYYVGRASIGWDGSTNVDEMALEARDRRFGRHHRQEVKAEWIKNKKNVNILWHGYSKTGPGTPDYRKAYAACRGQEHLHEAFWKGQTPSLSANKQAPISTRKLNTPIGQEYLAEGRNAGLEFCRGRY